MQTFDTVQELHEFVELLLHRIDQRYTVGRRAVVGLLASSERPLSISDIEARVPEIPRSSAYRHLSDLQRAGVVRRIAASDEFARFSIIITTFSVLRVAKSSTSRRLARSSARWRAWSMN